MVRTRLSLLTLASGGRGRRISAGVDGVRWRPRSSKPLWGCVAVPGGFDPHALPPPPFGGLCRSAAAALGWPPRRHCRPLAGVGLAARRHCRPLAGGVWRPLAGVGLAARRHCRPLAGVGLAARCGVWRWSRRVTARAVDRVRERFPLRESARPRDRAVGDSPAPGRARCRTGQDAQAPQVSAATSAYRRRTSRRPVPRRGVQAEPPRTAVPTPQRGRRVREARAGRMPPRGRVPRRGVQAEPPQERPCPLLLRGAKRSRRMPPNAPECPRADPSRGAESRLSRLKNGRAHSCQRGECPRMPPSRRSSQPKSNCCDSNRPSERYHSYVCSTAARNV